MQRPCSAINKQLMLCIPGTRAIQARQEERVKKTTSSGCQCLLVAVDGRSLLNQCQTWHANNQLTKTFLCMRGF